MEPLPRGKPNESKSEVKEQMKKLLTVFALLFVAPVFADDLTLDQFVNLLKTDLRAQAKDEIRLGMVTFTAEEAKLF